LVVFNTYGLGGFLSNHKTKQWRFWQPFLGGAKFVLLQALSWSFFTISVVLEIAFIVSTFALGFELFIGAAAVAGIFFIVSEVLMIVSLHFYLPSEKLLSPTTATSTTTTTTTGGGEGGGEKTKGSSTTTTTTTTTTTIIPRKFRLISVEVSHESLEQFRLLTVITFLANMQYLAFLLPIFPFLLTGVPVVEAGRHWSYFFVCLTGWVVVNTYVKTMTAKAQNGGKRRNRRRDVVAQLLPLAVWTLPGYLTYHHYHHPCFPAWIFLSCLYYTYFYTTFHGKPEYTGRRYLGPELNLFPNFSLYSILDGVEKYFKGQIFSTSPLDPKGTYVFAFHPHGVQPFTVMWLQLSRAWRENFKGMRFCVMTASVMHFVPLMRDILQWLGGREVSRDTIMGTLAEKQSILLIPGGQQEMMVSRSNINEIRVLSRHVGFIKIAIQSGVPLVPVLSFGEEEVMDFVRVPRLQNFFITRVGLPVPFLPYGLFGFPIPRPVPVTVVFGTPIPVPHHPNPPQEVIKALAKVYFEQIKEIFHKYKDAAGCPNHRLVLIE